MPIFQIDIGPRGLICERFLPNLADSDTEMSNFGDLTWDIERSIKSKL